nr:MAG TPA: Regulatory protein-modification, helix-turn-helix, transcriptional regulator, DNA [Caudoviricetes sp.]
MTDVIALKKCIEDSGLSVTFVAEKAGILRETFYNRMKTGDFKGSEICALSRVLGLSRIERDKIFFASDSELNSQKRVSRKEGA